MSDFVWRNVLTGEGWTPGASSGAGSPGTATPTQVMGLIGQGLAAGATMFSTIFGAINNTNPAAGTVTVPGAAGAPPRQVPPGALGNVSSTGGSGTTDLNVDVEEEGFFAKPTNLVLVMGGGALLLVLLMGTRR